MKATARELVLDDELPEVREATAQPGAPPPQETCPIHGCALLLEGGKRGVKSCPRCG